MNLIVCLDIRNGMAFNNRRQTSDIAVTEGIRVLLGSHTLWVNDYSGYLFADFNGNIRISDNFLNEAKQGEYCYVENQDILPHLYKFSKVFVFRWNRVYPCDLKFPNVLRNGEVLGEFPGNSHERITLEVYLL